MDQRAGGNERVLRRTGRESADCKQQEKRPSEWRSARRASGRRAGWCDGGDDHAEDRPLGMAVGVQGGTGLPTLLSMAQSQAVARDGSKIRGRRSPQRRAQCDAEGEEQPGCPGARKMSSIGACSGPGINISSSAASKNSPGRWRLTPVKPPRNRAAPVDSGEEALLPDSGKTMSSSQA